MKPLLPPLPSVEPEVVERCVRAMDDVAAALSAADEPARALFTAVQHRHVVEALTTVIPVASTTAAPVITPRRRFLSGALSGRTAAVRNALRHLDTRVAMVGLGALDHVVARETPYVLNALVEGQSPGGHETNAGSIRVTSSSFKDADNDYTPPEAARCGELLDAAVEVATTVPAQPVVTAGWLTLSMFAIHPFVDGNGRTARLLFHGIHSSAAGNGIDWGTIETWGLERHAYLSAIHRSVRPAGDGRVELVDPLPFIGFVTASVVAGAERVTRRLAALNEQLDRSQRTLGNSDEALVHAFVWSERNVRHADLVELALPDDRARAACNRLVAGGHLTWSERHGLNLRRA